MGSVRKKGAGYEARYRDPSGRDRGKSFRTKAEARTFLAHAESAKHRGEWTDPKRGRVKFSEFATEWMSTTVHLKPRTQLSYEGLLKRHVLPYFGDAPLHAIERLHIQAWVSELSQRGAGPGTIRNAYRVLSRILNDAERSRMIPRSPANGIPLPKSKRQEMNFLSPTEIIELSTHVSARYRCLILMAGFVGLRWGELAALRAEHLDLLRGVVDVRQSLSDVNGHLIVVSTKTGERRSVPLPRFLCEALAEHLAQYASGELVFSSPEGKGLRHQNFYRRQWKPALRSAGIDRPIRFHDLRHSAASLAIAMGANVKQVQQMLGHSSATVTLDTYSHILPSLSEQLKDGIEATFRDAELKSRVGNPWETPSSEPIQIANLERKHAR